MEAVTLSNLTIGYKNGNDVATVASNINVGVEPGTLICLCGPNGGGKSTLLRTIARLQKPVDGDILLSGRPYTDIPQADFAHLLSIVTPHRIQQSELTVSDLVSLGRNPYTGFWGRLSAYDSRLIRTAMEQTGIAPLANRRISSLSDGEQQKALIAKCLAQNTDIIILDEPTAFLDYPSKAEIMILLKKLCLEENKTIIFSSHDLDIAFTIVHRLWMIDATHGLTTGTVDELGLSGAIDRYFSTGQMKFENGRFVLR